MADILLTAKEIKTEWGYDSSSLKRWEEQGKIPGGVIRTPGGQRRYLRKSIEALTDLTTLSTSPIVKQSQTGNDKYGELGTTGLSRFGGSVYTESSRELQGASGRKLYREMRTSDPVISSMFFALIHSLKKAQERIQPASEKPADIEAAEFVESALKDMSFTWSDTFTFIADPCFEQGFSLLEMVYKKRLGERPGKYVENPSTSQFNDGKIGWRKWAPRPAETLVPGNEWIFDDFGGIQGINQYDPYSGRAIPPIPIEKLLHFRTSVYPANTPEPPPIHRAAYLPYWYTTNLQEIEGIGIERNLNGMPVLYLGADCTMDAGTDSDLTRGQNLVTNIRNDEQMGVVLPKAKMGSGATEGNGMLLELLSTGAGQTLDIGPVIERYDKRKAIIILAQFIMLGMDQVGSYALSRSQNDMFILAATAWLNSFADIINRHAIPRLMKMNAFPGITGMPKLVFSPLGIPDLAGISEYVNKLVDKAVLTPDEELERHLRQMADLPQRVEVVTEASTKPQIAKVSKAEPAGKLTETGQAALEITESLERQIRQEWERLTANIAKGTAVGAALSLYRRKAENLIRQGLADAWLTGRGEDLNEAEAKEIDKAVADQMDYLKGFMAEMEKGLSEATDREEKGGILLANAARAVSYAGAAWSLYNVAKVFGANPSELWAWSGPSGDGKICAGCQEEMDLGARPLSKMTRLPGSANCLTNCRHELVRIK